MPDAPRWLDADAERAVCCGPVCKRPPDDCVAASYGAGIIARAEAAGFQIVRVAVQRPIEVTTPSENSQKSPGQYGNWVG